MNQEQPNVGRVQVLNGANGMTNCVESDVIRQDLAKVTNEIFTKLSDHYGPYSMFAGIDPNKPMEDTVFTKDGANIVRSMSYASIQEDWARKIISYVGNNIENEAGDGTTSAMMFACGMLRNMYSSIDELRPISYHQLKSYFNEFIEEVKCAIKPHVLTAERDGTYDSYLVRVLAYCQAYTSSHGNEELAQAVANVFSKTPADMWKRMGFQRRMYESDKEFEVISSEGQYETDAKIMTKSVYNAGLKRYLEYKSATLIILNESVMMDSPFWKRIEETIRGSTEEKPVVIFAHSPGDGVTFGELMKLTRESDDNGLRKYCFAVISHNPQDEHPAINDFVALQTIVGADMNRLADDCNRPVFVENVYVKFESDKVVFDHLYEAPERSLEDGVEYRPQYNDAKYPYFRMLVDGVRENIDAYENKGTLTRGEERGLLHLRKMLVRLLFDKRYTLVIGGKTYDNLAMFDVVDDVIRAVRAGLEKGMVVSNNKALYLACCKIYEDFHHVSDKKGRSFAWFAQCIKNTLSEFASVVWTTLLLDRDGEVKQSTFDDFKEWWLTTAVDLLTYDTSRGWSRQFEYNQRNVADITNETFVNYNLEEHPLIVQPANADIVMLERFGEIALKFILTKRLIFDNAVYLKKEGKK